MSTRDDDIPTGDALPRDLLGALMDDDDAPTSALDAVRARIASDLEARQGPYRKKSALARGAPFVVAALFAAGFALAMKPAPGVFGIKLAAVVVAFLTGLVALVAAALAPARPAASERLSMAALGAGVVALVLEIGLALTLPTDRDLGLACFAMTIAGGLAPIVVVALALRASGLPVRPLHALSAASAGLALAGASVWLHCPSERALHLVVGHAALPAALVVVLTLVFSRVLVRRAV